jgi:cysteine-rich repeat protein
MAGALKSTVFIALVLTPTVAMSSVTCEITFRLLDTISLGTLQWDTRYSRARGEFVGDAGQVQCSKNVGGGALTQFNDRSDERRFSAGIISVAGFEGPSDLAQCQFRAGVVPTGSHFTISVTEASDADPENPQPVFPVPSIVASAIECVGTPDVCGDTTVGEFEECDDGGIVDGDGCSRLCEIERKCGDATGDGKVMASDALRILQRAVGLDVDCPTWICDVDGNGVRAGDALKILRESTQLPIAVHCSAPTKVVLRLLSSENFGSLHVSVDYADVSGDLDGQGDQVNCQALQPGIGASFNNKPTRTVAATFLSQTGVHGPGSLASCRFFPSGVVDSDDFQVTVTDATNNAGLPIEKPSIVAIPY